MITGLLVVYPVLATVVAVMVGLFLSGPVAALELAGAICAGPNRGMMMMRALALGRLMVIGILGWTTPGQTASCTRARPDMPVSTR